MIEEFVPEEFIVPKVLETESFRLRMLSVEDLEKDYEAVMFSRKHIRELYSEIDDDTWPEENMKIEENLEDLYRHEKEFENRGAFVYTVMTLDEKLCLGCVYINPSDKQCFDAEVYLWAREIDIESALYKTVEKWIKEKWPFSNVAYPIFQIKASEWKKLQ
jgi:hypothetical protein